MPDIQIKRFDSIGDMIKGTYIEKFELPSPLSDRTINVYRIKMPNSEERLIYGKVDIDRQMRTIQIGQIVRFEYIGDQKLNTGFKTTKMIRVESDANEVDGPFLLAENKRLRENMEWVKTLATIPKSKMKRVIKKLKK